MALTPTFRVSAASLVLCVAAATGSAAARASSASGPAPADRATSGHGSTDGRPSGAPAGARMDPALSGARGDTAVVVRTTGPAAAAAAQGEVHRAGGRVTDDLAIVDGFAATVPAGALARLARVTGVEVLSADRRVEVRGTAASAGGTAALAPRVVQAPAAWAAGATGAGVTVAVVDTGIADVPDLAGRIVPVRSGLLGGTSPCHDLSGEGNCRDTYGHGTFVAGLIAGTGASGERTGSAPGARVLSVKVAGADGAADVSTVLAAIQWVVSFRETYGIRVLNLSVGTNSTQSWRDDPLNYAVERAWDAGILVVVAAANNGPQPGSIAKPADDPWVLTVGAVDDRGTVGLADDTAPDFTSRGPTREGVAKPDLVGPGAHVRSLRSPGSTLDRIFPRSAGASGPYRSGSGTSMAAAVVSGVAAAVLDAHPTLTPNQLKYALTAGARPVASSDRSIVGAGMADALGTVVRPATGSANAGLDRSTGRGDLGASRGTLQLQTTGLVPAVLGTRQTAQTLLWDPVGFTTGSWTPSTWNTSVHALVGWNTMRWTTDLSGSNWTGSNWTGSNWTGSNWTGSNWTGSNWTGSSWYGVAEDDTSYGRASSGSASYGAWD